ncbi:MAG: hypothetical protein DHS20C09_11310 [marine bacterium B5-7]|nr:MAG: hypothetical protein DHS20C09_11310 [marine bacterium B5-7]
MAYEGGSLLGIAMDDTPLGEMYAKDFIDFMDAHVDGWVNRTILEVGPGRGYLLRLMNERGAEAIGVEPGAQNKVHWQRHGVDVRQGMFPSDALRGPYDVIVAHGVLEHIEDPITFLHAMRDVLHSKGMAFFAVPDCGPYISAGDPSILLHEHYSYFTIGSLSRLLQIAGFGTVKILPAAHGGILYCMASPSSTVRSHFRSDNDQQAVTAYGHKVKKGRARVAALGERIRHASLSHGVYCPARGLNLLPPGLAVRFFDDDHELTGRYYPTFPYPVETRNDLVSRPVDELWILSRSFGDHIRNELMMYDLKGSRVLTISELLEE